MEFIYADLRLATVKALSFPRQQVFIVNLIAAVFSVKRIATIKVISRRKYLNAVELDLDKLQYNINKKEKNERESLVVVVCIWRILIMNYRNP